MNLLKRVTAFIGWLSGSLAGIGALLYGFGYLITLAHLNLLGIERLLVSSNERFVQEGARFVIVTGELLTKKLLGIMAILGVLVLPAVIVYALLSRFLPAWLTRGVAGWAATKARLANVHRHLPWAPDLSGYMVVLLLLYLHLLSYLPEFIPPLKLSGLLYETGDTVGGGGAGQAKLLCWLLTENSARLKNHFSGLLDVELLAIVFVVLAWRITARRTQQALLVAPFLAVLLLYTVYLPMLYGVLVHSRSYNLVRLVSDGEPPTQSPVFLLQKTDGEFIVWNPLTKVVLWIPKAGIRLAEIQQGAVLFKEKRVCRD